MAHPAPICDCWCCCSNRAAADRQACESCAKGEHCDTGDEDGDAPYDPDAEVKFQRENPKEDE